jgi:hypothetical protein
VVWSNSRQRITDRTMPPQGVRRVIMEMLEPFPPEEARKPYQLPEYDLKSSHGI